MAKAAEHDELRTAFESHLQEIEEHVNRLEQVFGCFGEKPRARKCKGMQGLIEEGQERIKEKEGDAALICAAQKVEHYEIAAYGSLYSWAKLLDQADVAELLEETLQEEKDTDDKLTETAEGTINVEEHEQERSGSRSR